MQCTYWILLTDTCLLASSSFMNKNDIDGNGHSFQFVIAGSTINQKMIEEIPLVFEWVILLVSSKSSIAQSSFWMIRMIKGLIIGSSYFYHTSENNLAICWERVIYTWDVFHWTLFTQLNTTKMSQKCIWNMLNNLNDSKQLILSSSHSNYYSTWSQFWNDSKFYCTAFSEQQAI